MQVGLGLTIVIGVGNNQKGKMKKAEKKKIILWNVTRFGPRNGSAHNSPS